MECCFSSGCSGIIRDHGISSLVTCWQESSSRLFPASQQTWYSIHLTCLWRTYRSTNKIIHWLFDCCPKDNLLGPYTRVLQKPMETWQCNKYQYIISPGLSVVSHRAQWLSLYLSNTSASLSLNINTYIPKVWHVSPFLWVCHRESAILLQTGFPFPHVSTCIERVKNAQSAKIWIQDQLMSC